MAKITLNQLKKMIREAVSDHLDKMEEQISGGINVQQQGKPGAGKRTDQPGGVQGLVGSGMSAEQLAQQFEQATDPAQKQQYLQAFNQKLQGMSLEALVALVKGVTDPKVKQLAQNAAGAAFKRAIGLGKAGGNVAPPPVNK